MAVGEPHISQTDPGGRSLPRPRVAAPFWQRFQVRVAVSYVVLIGVLLAGLGLVLVPYLRAKGYAALEDDLHRQAALIAEHASLLLAVSGPASLEPAATRLGAGTRTRVTLIDAGGRVLGDSEHDPATMDNHATRPEVARALAGGNGESQRFSATLERDLLYVALPITSGDTIVGVARVALPVSEVERSINSLVAAAVLALVVAALISVILATTLARMTTRPIGDLTAAALALSGGTRHRPIPIRGNDEISMLSAAFNQMAAGLEAQLRELREGRERLEAILRDMADGVVLIDPDGRIRTVNPAAERILSLPADATLGRSFAEAVRDYELVEAVRAAMKDTSAPRSRLVELGPAGGKRIVQSVATGVRSEIGGRPGVLLILQDVTDLRRADTVRREFVANASHDLRTPVATIKAIVETLEDGAIADPPAAKDFLGRMHAEVDGLAHLIEDLMQLSRIESGQVEMNRGRVEMCELVRAAVDHLSPLAERQGVDLVAEDGEACHLDADPERIQQVLVNLVHNSIKYTPPGGRIVVRAGREPGGVIVTVTDTGSGVASEDLPRLFERFYKSDRSRTSGGTGLGLAIAKHIVEAHGGRIWAESPGEGRGATFGFALPG